MARLGLSPTRPDPATCYGDLPTRGPHARRTIPGAFDPARDGPGRDHRGPSLGKLTLVYKPAFLAGVTFTIPLF